MDMSMSTKTTTLMRKLGIKPNLLGWRYIQSAVGIVIDDPMAIDSVTKHIYPAIARIHGVTITGVERAIRHSIKCAFSHAPINVLSAVFGNSVDVYRGHATNSEFIAAIAQVVAHEPGNPVWNM